MLGVSVIDDLGSLTPALGPPSVANFRTRPPYMAWVGVSHLPALGSPPGMIDNLQHMLTIIVLVHSLSFILNC